MTPGAMWMVGGLVLAALEMLAPGFFLLWIGLAALGTGAATELAGLGEPGQVGLFVALAVVLAGAIGVRGRRRAAPDLVNAPAAGLVGRMCHAVSFADGEGRVSLGDGMWRARLSDGATQPQPGAALRVTGLDGTVLLVGPP